MQVCPYSTLDLPAATQLCLKWFDDAEWVKCSVAGKQPRQKRKDPTSWRGWYVLVFDDFESSEAFDLLSLARRGRVRYYQDRQLGRTRWATSVAVGAEIMRRGLVRQSNDFSSRG